MVGDGVGKSHGLVKEVAFPLVSCRDMDSLSRGVTRSDLEWLLCEQTIGAKLNAGRANIQVRGDSGLNWGASGGGGEP